MAHSSRQLWLATSNCSNMDHTLQFFFFLQVLLFKYTISYMYFNLFEGWYLRFLECFEWNKNLSLVEWFLADSREACPHFRSKEKELQALCGVVFGKLEKIPFHLNDQKRIGFLQQLVWVCLVCLILQSKHKKSKHNKRSSRNTLLCRQRDVWIQKL